MTRKLGTPKGDDAGFSLIELMVTGLLTVVVLGIIGGIFISTSQTQQRVQSVTSATTGAQQASRSIVRGITNSTAFKLVANGSDQLLIARTLTSDAAGTAICSAWYFTSANGGSIRYTKLTTVLAAPPAAATVATWTLLDSGVVPATGTTIFARATTTDPALTIAFSSTAGTNKPVQVSTSAISRVNGTDVSACYSGS